MVGMAHPILMSSPPLTPFQRLHVTDGLLITAEHWQRSHSYSRSRQNFHYQSLHQAGIVTGLGVTVLPASTPPSSLSASASSQTGQTSPSSTIGSTKITGSTNITGSTKITGSDNRDLLIQPGIAIDYQGNPIIVPEAMTFRIRTQAPEGRTACTYLVLNYVDPDELSLPGRRDYLPETFRIVEKTSLSDRDVELCRIEIRSGLVQLQAPSEPQFGEPGPHILDLRHRQVAQPKPQATIRVAHLLENQPSDSATHDRLTQLLRSIQPLSPNLQPSLQGDPNVDSLQRSTLSQTDLSAYDLLYCSFDSLLRLDPDPHQRRPLAQYLHNGGVLTIVIPRSPSDRDRLTVIQDLRNALLTLQRDEPNSPYSSRLQSDLSDLETQITNRIQRIFEQLAPLAHSLENPLDHPGDLDRQHPLRQQPFLFGALPSLDQHPIRAWNWGGIVLLFGDISQNWGLDDDLSQPRETLRTAQEFGINLLHFAWQRRQLRTLTKLPTP